MSGWLYKVQHDFRPGYPCESQVVRIYQDIGNSLNDIVWTDAIIIIVFSEAFDLIPHDRPLTKIAETGVDLREVVWVKEEILLWFVKYSENF